MSNETIEEPKTLILVGLEGPELVNQITGRLYWHPMATDGHWRAMVKSALIEFFERNAQDEYRWDVKKADVVIFRNQADFTNALRRKGEYGRVIVYCHGDDGGLMPVITKWSTHVRPYLIAKTLAEADVKTAVLLGCESKKLAETSARIAENYVKIVGIEPPRQDDVTMRKLTILNVILWPFGGRESQE